MADPKPPTRDQLAKFLPDAESIKLFERLFAVAGNLTPTDIAALTRLVEETSVDAGTATSKANEALDILSRIADSLDLLAKAPPQRQEPFLTGDYIDVSTTAPAPNGAVGRMRWNDTDGTLDLGLKGGNVTLQLGQENVLRAKNDEVTTLNDGEVVYITGASGANLLVKRALADSDLTSATTIGVVTEPIAPNGQGFITTFGQVRGLNTSAFNEGDALYLSPTVPGAITATKPVAPQHMVLVGYCTKKSAGNGEIFVKVDNGYEIDELHNVLITTPVLAGSLLIYDATTGVWKNARLTAGTNVVVTNADGSITIAVTSAAPSGSAGGVLSGTYPNPGFAVDMATQTELDTAIATREPTIAAGTTAQYWRGDKTWRDFFTDVRATTLTGLSTATNAVITAADTVLSALGKIQARLNTLGTAATTDYSTGTWTPVATATIPGITPPTIASASGTYTKIGRTVYCTYNILFGANGTGAGQIKLTGNPFTPSQRGFGAGMETDVLGFNTLCQTIASTDATYIGKTDTTYPGGTSFRLMGNFSYIV